MSKSEVWTEVLKYYEAIYGLPDKCGDYRGICFVISDMLDNKILTPHEYHYVDLTLDMYGDALEHHYNQRGKQMAPVGGYFWTNKSKELRIDWIKQQIEETK